MAVLKSPKNSKQKNRWIGMFQNKFKHNSGKLYANTHSNVSVFYNIHTWNLFKNTPCINSFVTFQKVFFLQILFTTMKITRLFNQLNFYKVYISQFNSLVQDYEYDSHLTPMHTFVLKKKYVLFPLKRKRINTYIPKLWYTNFWKLAYYFTQSRSLFSQKKKYHNLPLMRFFKNEKFHINDVVFLTNFVNLYLTKWSLTKNSNFSTKVTIKCFLALRHYRNTQMSSNFFAPYPVKEVPMNTDLLVSYSPNLELISKFKHIYQFDKYFRYTNSASSQFTNFYTSWHLFTNFGKLFFMSSLVNIAYRRLNKQDKRWNKLPDDIILQAQKVIYPDTHQYLVSSVNSPNSVDNINTVEDRTGLKKLTSLWRVLYKTIKDWIFGAHTTPSLRFFKHYYFFLKRIYYLYNLKIYHINYQKPNMNALHLNNTSLISACRLNRSDLYNRLDESNKDALRRRQYFLYLI